MMMLRFRKPVTLEEAKEAAKYLRKTFDLRTSCRISRHRCPSRRATMTILTNPRHELYTQLRKACSRSMRTSRAGYERNFSHAARLAGAPDIKYRVSELQQRRVTVQDEAITMTVTQGLEELEAARVGAMEAGRSTTRLQPRVAKLKTAGLWVERSERATVKLEPSKLSDEELVARIAAAEQADRPQ